MKAIITGSTGMVGNLVLKHCIDSDEITKVVTIGRRSTQLSSSKLEELVIHDFMDYSDIEDHFEAIDIAYFCLGEYTGAVPDDEFKKITVDFVRAFADVLKKRSPDAKFILLSGSGADQTEKSRMSFAKYKGMAENYLISKNFPEVYFFRPGYIFPVEKRKEPNLMYSVSRALYPIIKVFGKNASIKSTELARGFFEAGIRKAPKREMENKDILEFIS